MAVMDVYWLEQAEADVPAENRWLSAREMVALDSMRFAKRRNDWRLGRWTAKCALAACLNLPSDLFALANTEIRAAPSGEPELYLLNQKSDVTISLSHRSGTALCAVALSGASIGCDLEMIEARSNAFIADYFTVNEQALVERTPAEQRPMVVTLLWSAKESALKALHVGLRLDTTSLDVKFAEELLPPSEQDRQDLPLVPKPAANPDKWRPLHICYLRGQAFRGWWRHANHMVRTVVSALPLRSPIHCASFSLDGFSPEGIAIDS
jgi:4'-phosphopantetheinyl transferase